MFASMHGSTELRLSSPHVECRGIRTVHSLPCGNDALISMVFFFSPRFPPRRTLGYAFHAMGSSPSLRQLMLMVRVGLALLRCRLSEALRWPIHRAALNRRRLLGPCGAVLIVAAHLLQSRPHGFSAAWIPFAMHIPCMWCVHGHTAAHSLCRHLSWLRHVWIPHWQ